MMRTVTTSQCDREQSVHVTLFHRSKLPPGSNLGEIRHRLERLTEEDHIDHFSQEVWPSKATIETGTKTWATSLYAEFEEIATQLNISLEPYFERYRRVNQLTGTAEDVIVFPTVAVLVSDPSVDRPYALAPCTSGSVACSLEDLLTELERTQPPSTNTGRYRR